MFAAVAFTVLVIGQSQPSEPRPLRWGSTPPPLQVSQWITKRPPALPGPQTEGAERIFVIHFWSMRDDRSRAAMPHLAQLHATFADQRVIFIAISNEDPDDLTSFCGQQDDTLPYAVAADDENLTSEHWLDEVSAFPWTFVLDRGGRVIWSGDSMWTLRDVVAGAVEGRYTLATARQRVDAVKKIEELTAAMNDAMGNGDLKAVTRIADRIVKADPARIEGYAMKRSLLKRIARRGEGDAKLDRDLAKLYESLRAASWDATAGLAELLDWQWAESDLRHRDPALMHRCASRLVELTRRKDPFALAMLARVLHELGMHDEAIAAQREAAKRVAWDPNKQFTSTLGYYERVQRTAAEARHSPTGTQPASSPSKQP